MQERIELRIDAEKKQKWAEAASAVGMSLSDFIREATDQRAATGVEAAPKAVSPKAKVATQKAPPPVKTAAQAAAQVATVAASKPYSKPHHGMCVCDECEAKRPVRLIR